MSEHPDERASMMGPSEMEERHGGAESDGTESRVEERIGLDGSEEEIACTEHHEDDRSGDKHAGAVIEGATTDGAARVMTTETPVERCRNCGEPLAGRYCYHCGQKVMHHHEYSLKAFLGHALHDLTHFDLKIFKTLPAIIFKPGKVTDDHFAGRQARYVGPIQLFIIVNLLFFLLKAGGFLHYTLEGYGSKAQMAMLIERSIARLGVRPDIYEAMFDTSMHFQQKSYIILLIPIFALLMKLLYVRSKRYYVEHLIFSLHFFSFYLFFLLILPLILSGLTAGASLFGASISGDDTTIFALVLPTMAIYLAIALRRVYGQSYPLASLKGAVLAFSLVPLIILYQVLLFYIVWFSL